ncbi:hypothetical protein ACWKSP_36525 [Micromonosporaceae bacterium Da 78-11]
MSALTYEAGTAHGRRHGQAAHRSPSGAAVPTPALTVIDLEGRATGIVGLENGQEISTPLEGHTNEIHALAVGTPGGRPTAVTGGDDGTVRIWDLRARIQRHALIVAGGPLELRRWWQSNRC